MHLLFEEEKAVLDALRGIAAVHGICDALKADGD
jgi:hypothetical protein